MFVLYQVAFLMTGPAANYNVLFVGWVILYSALSIAILGYILYSGVEKDGTDPVVVSGVRLSAYNKTKTHHR